MPEEKYEIRREDEIDLIDILTVLIKRRNVILFIVIAALIFFRAIYF